MQMSEFRQAREFARKYGAKTVAFGPPGVGKTPVTNTAPRPILMFCEPGMLSMRSSTIMAVDCFTPARIDAFFAWLFGSKEAANFDTVAIDSLSQMAELYLTESLKNKKDGRAAYGEMSTKVMAHLNGLYFLQQKHTYLICKQAIRDIEGTAMRVPYFPGQELPVKVPHLYDVILHFAVHSIPSQGQHRAFRCAASFDTVARDRSGNLAEFEPPDLAAIFAKIMA